jgi:L-ascorbate metabolism protein UlaG (beta-lactamase superfamily)
MKITALGQVGLIVESIGARIAIDPYLTNSVAETYGPEFDRLVPPPIEPEDLPELDWLLITHAHMDHADPETLRRLCASQPSLKIMAPYDVREFLEAEGLGMPHAPFATPSMLCGDITVRAIPAAHTSVERNESGELRFCGYYIEIGGQRLYHAGDTIPHPEIFEALHGEPIHIAFLPVNERNYFRDARGIVGNMSVREAFQMAADLGVRTLVPTHWDLFALNRTYSWEIEALYEFEKPPFALQLMPAGTTFSTL